MIDFPTSPFVGQIYSFGDFSWVCTVAGATPAWRLIPNQGQASNIVRTFVRVVTTNTVSADIADRSYV